MEDKKVIDRENDVYIDVNKIPDYVAEKLARATLDFIHSIYAQPGGREMLEKKKMELGLI